MQLAGTTITLQRPEVLFDFNSRFARLFGTTGARPFDYLVHDGVPGIVALQPVSGDATEINAAESRPQLKVVLNWFAELKERVPTN